ncbi:MAG: hypothetical protein H7Z71_05710 [Moraxellaceae bacterium]|nr:hypothetical protein [Pseudobdellovibrionaceae bacterium]
MTKTFSEILSDQLSQNTCENSVESVASHFSSGMDYAYFSELKFARTQPFSSGSLANSRSKYRMHVPEKPIDYILETHQKAALNWLNQRLSPDHRLIGRFSAYQLKTAFRRLAKASHPDLGGTPESFRELMSCFKVLSKLFHV